MKLCRQKVLCAFSAPAMSLVTSTAVSTLAVTAGAEALEPQSTSDSPSRETPRHRPKRIIGTHLDTHSGWSLGLEGYAGLTTLSTNEGTKGHAIAGGVSRVRVGFVEVGAGLEASDEAGERWRSLGGFAGAFVPFTNWVDFDAALGFALRSYVNPDVRYGPTGITVRVPELTLRLGLSDRVTEGLIGPRLGAALLFGIDLKHRDVDWAYKIDNATISSGTTSFGGVTAGLVMSFGLDLARRRDD